jgi:predicted transcriptional regulator
MVDPLDETARSALAKSCYLKINWKIFENEAVSEAVARMVAHDIGALAVFDSKGEICGVLSERDVIKVGHLNKRSKETKVSEICTYGKANLVSVTLDNPIDKCMSKMLDSNVRHLLVRERDTGVMVGMISVKDIVKCATAKQDAVIGKLTEMVVINTIMNKDT